MNAARSIRSLPALVTSRSAEIQGQIVSVPAGCRGTVGRVLVAENQPVREGDVLMEVRAARHDATLPRSLQASWTAALKGPEVRSPVGGRVVLLEVETSDLVGRSQPVAAILQGDDLWIVAEFHRDDADGLRPGQRAFVQASGLEFTARIEWIDADGSALLEFEREELNPADVLLPGAPVQVSVDRDQPRFHLR